MPRGELQSREVRARPPMRRAPAGAGYAHDRARPGERERGRDRGQEDESRMEALACENHVKQ